MLLEGLGTCGAARSILVFLEMSNGKLIFKKSVLLTPPQDGTFPHDVITIVSKHFDKSLIHEVRFDQHP